MLFDGELAPFSILFGCCSLKFNKIIFVGDNIYYILFKVYIRVI